MARFHLFNRLPAELRFQIWEDAIDNELQPVLTVRIATVGWLLTSIPTPPGGLLTSRESRNTALKHSGMRSFRIGSAKHSRRIYFNPSITILEVELVTSNKYGKTTRSYKVNPEEKVTWKKLERLLQGALHATEHMHILRLDLREKLYDLWDTSSDMGHGSEPVFDKLVNLKIVSEGMISFHAINRTKTRWCGIQHGSSIWCGSGGCISFLICIAPG